ncbi:hypothetical protein ACMFMG_011336 [Clarireedia jacksonii]
MSSSRKRKATDSSRGPIAKQSRATEMASETYDMSPVALFKANKLVNDLKESQIRILLVQAYLAHSDIAQAVETEHAKMEHWDVAAAPSESGSNVAGDLDDEEDEKDFSIMGIRTAADRNRKVTELVHPRLYPDSASCSCTTQCSTASCACTKMYANCSPGCKCITCQNRFNELAQFFGESRLQATYCYAAWREGQDTDFDLNSARAQEELRSMLMGVDEGNYDAAPLGEIFTPGYDEDMFKIGQNWIKAKTAEERAPIRKELLRHALLEGKGPFFSFCRGGWEVSESTIHCPVCEECNDWGAWHCRQCGKCTDSVSLPCDGCGGVSSTYHDMEASG